MNVNDIIRPLNTADSEYSVCGNSVLRKAKVVEVLPRRKENGNNIKIEILEHVDPRKVGKVYTVDDRYFKVEEADWIWIDAYKATDKDMRCLNHQYRMGLNMYDGKPVLGSKGFHVAVNLKDTFKNYPYDFRNRYFKVKALVNAKDYQYRNPNNTTLVAKQVNFVCEISNGTETLNAYRAYLG